MVTVAIVGLMAAVALPFYNDYIETAEISVAMENANSIRLFQEDRKLYEGTYVAGVYPDNGDDPNLGALLNWDPRTGDTNIYVVDQVTANGFRITACKANPGLDCGGGAEILYQADCSGAVCQ